MIVFLNGKFVPEEAATVSVFDRSFLYGDGLFETLRVSNGKPFRWAQHLQRMVRGAERLKIKLQYTPDALAAAASELVQLNRLPDALLRITLSRGVGPRGYSPTGANHPLVVLSLHPAPAISAAPTLWTLLTSSHRLNEADTLTRLKSSNKLVQILARQEAEEHGAGEALLLNTRNEVCETSGGNLFWIEQDRLLTPPVEAGLLPGVTRSVIMELAPTLGLATGEARVGRSEITRSEGAFITLSSLGIVEVLSIDGCTLPKHPQTQLLHTAYQRLLAAETT